MRDVEHRSADIEGRPAVWLKGTEVVEAVGESYFQEHLVRVAGPPQPVASHQLEVVAWLSPEPIPQDPKAVALRVQGGLVGYLPRGLTAVWQPALLALSARDQRPVACFAKIVGGTRRATDGEAGYYSVRVFLPPAPL